MIVVFIGPPFAGKGTQTQLLGRTLGLPVFSMGAIIREAYKAGNPLAVKGFKEYSMKGLHLPIALKFSLLKERLDKAQGGFILDNFPATQEDLDTFIAYLNKHRLKVDKVFNLNITEDSMQRRMKARGRPDDDLSIIKKRREVQDRDRSSVIDYFEDKGLLVEINGEKEIGAVHKEIMDQLDK